MMRMVVVLSFLGSKPHPNGGRFLQIKVLELLLLLVVGLLLLLLL